MTDKEVPFFVGHRERLKDKLLDEKLADYEKLELLLTFAIPRRDVKPLARKLLQHFGTVYFVLHAQVAELMKVPGVGKSTAVLIKLFHELMLVTFEERAKSGTYLADEKFRVEYCRSLVVGKPVEEVHVLYLGPGYRLIEDEIHTRGTINESAVYLREIAIKVLQKNVWGIILVHNHPMSNNEFSHDDIIMTSAIDMEMQRLNVVLVDHLLVQESGTVISYRQRPWQNMSSFNNT